MLKSAREIGRVNTSVFQYGIPPLISISQTNHPLSIKSGSSSSFINKEVIATGGEEGGGGGGGGGGFICASGPVMIAKLSEYSASRII